MFPAITTPMDQPATHPIFAPRPRPSRSAVRGSNFVAAVARGALLLFASFAAASLRAETRLANIFADHMVLQRDLPMAIWGFANAGEGVEVEFAGQKKEAVAGADGAWKVMLAPLAGSGEPRRLVARETRSGSEAVLNDVLVGEVWLGGGQSNMAMSAGPEGSEADTPNVRFTFVESFYPGAPAPDLKSRCRWRDAGAKSAPSCSGTGLWFARRLQAELRVPVGIVVSAAGGSRAESWTRREVLGNTDGIGNYVAKILEEVAKAKASPHPASPEKKTAAFIAGSEEWMHGHLGGRFNGMIAPLTRLTIRGVIWYQGEDNARDHEAYGKLLPAMIADWRSAWGRELPFLIVQLPAYNADHKPDGTAWSAMREVQERIPRTVPGCGVAVTFDNTDPDQLHPKNKRSVGERLGLLALRQIYQRDVIASGPVFDSMKVSGDRVRIVFRELGGGLIARGGGALKGFTIAGADRQFVPADAHIEGDAVVLSAAALKEPAAVRYAWSNAPAVSLFNKAGLPAGPFRTDRWEEP